MIDMASSLTVCIVMLLFKEIKCFTKLLEDRSILAQLYKLM